MPRRVGVVGRTLGDVQARDAVGVEPVPGERERRALSDLEPEDVAVERLRRVEVVGQHEHVLEPRGHHQLVAVDCSRVRA